MKLQRRIAGLLVLVTLLLQLWSAVEYYSHGHVAWSLTLAALSSMCLCGPALYLLGWQRAAYPWEYTAEKLPPLGVRVIGLCGDDAEVLHLGADDQLPETYRKWCREDGMVLDTPPTHWALFLQNLPPLPILVRP